MKSLILDTSCDISYIIITNNNEIVFFKKIEKNQITKNIFLSLKKALEETNTKISDLSFIATSIGPGAFTSLRTSASIAKTFNFIFNIPLVGYVSLMAYTPQSPSSFCTVFDAKNDGVFLIEGYLEKDEIIYKKNTQLVNINDAKKIFENVDKILTPDREALIKKFESFKEKIELSFFNPQNVVDFTQKLYDEKKYFNHLDLNLLYLRGPNHIE